MRRCSCVAMLAALVLVALPGVAIAAPNQLSNGSVSPTIGTTSTSFTFTVHDQGDIPTRVLANLLNGGPSIQLSLVVSQGGDRTYRGSASGLPIGLWTVRFTADVPHGSVKPLTLATGLRITALPTPTPLPSPSPSTTGTPTPAPTTTGSGTPNPTTIPSPSINGTGPPLGSIPPATSGPATPAAVGGVAVTPEPTQASATPVVVNTASAAPGGSVANFLLAGIIVVGLLAAFAGLAAGRAASARVVPAQAGGHLRPGTDRPHLRDPHASAIQVPAGPAPVAADQAGTQERPSEAGEVEAGSRYVQIAQDDAGEPGEPDDPGEPGDSVQPGSMDETADQASDEAWTLDPEDPRAL